MARQAQFESCHAELKAFYVDVLCGGGCYLDLQNGRCDVAFGFVSGHDFSRAAQRSGKKWALAPAMAHPARNARPEAILASSRVFFCTTKTSMGRRLLQSDRYAILLVDVLRSYVVAGKFQLHDFVIMPDHLHLLMTIPRGMAIEKTMQLIKGGFSYRLKKECGYQGEVWQRGFSEVRINDGQSFALHQEYIAQNPVKAGLVESAEQYPYGYTYLVNRRGMAH